MPCTEIALSKRTIASLDDVSLPNKLAFGVQVVQWVASLPYHSLAKDEPVANY
jgi:hypothetical protein